MEGSVVVGKEVLDRIREGYLKQGFYSFTMIIFSE